MAQLWGHAATSLDGYVVCIGLSHSLTFTCQGSAQFSASPRQLPPLKADIKETGLEAHHLIEQRFAGVMGQKASGMASIAVTDTEHQAFTNAWRKAIPYGPDGTGTATRMEVETSAPQIYADYPDIPKALGL